MGGDRLRLRLSRVGSFQASLTQPRLLAIPVAFLSLPHPRSFQSSGPACRALNLRAFVFWWARLEIS